ncbi:MAG TPA: adenylate/guanylate cyclase domain-containing protein [Candidatus Baltobacteraceae bacterium]|nr:adenylate/guanylate cyclase domain-containing protein [Candidatus Baltobacteraceae bacterium]
MQSARILRVGGSAGDNQTLEGLLRGAGQSDVRFSGVAEALDAIASRSVDLLLLDLMQPSNDVFNLLRAAQPANGKTSRVPVIVTAPTTANDRVQACLQRGAEDYVVTPFDANNALVLTRRIELCLHRKHLREFTIRLRAAKSDDNAVMELYSSASNKFVPREFLEHLNRKTITDVRLGDHVQREMAVFFSDIRDFTRLSEGMTPQENFNFLNSYLKRATPIIRSNHGFIDKYIGDAIMALFPREPIDALRTGVELQRALVKYNQGRKIAGYEPVRIGIGLHSGELILGTIGEEERMQTTVIADAVNVAARIEGLTKVFGVSLLLGKSIVDRLPPDHGFHLRHLGAVRAKGKMRSVEIYECFDNDPPELMQHKINTADLFGNAINQFREALFLSAGNAFARVSQMNAQDTVAAHYRDSCSLAVLKGGGPAWDGAERIETK